jgi:SMODS and SLOG-associating 2TM effector domain 3/SMODS and SLOG-associating 2TM effector domain 1
MPELFRLADATSQTGQRRFMQATSSRLALAIAAAVCGTLSYLVKIGAVEILSIAAAAAFAVAFLIEIWLLSEAPDRRWFDGRALAESAKTLTWRYAVGGSPFPLSQGDADHYFIEQLAELLNDAGTTNIFPSAQPATSAPVSELRRRSLEHRRERYLRERILEQQQWYAQKAHYNARRAGYWRLALIILELAGVVVAALKAFGVIHIDLTSIVSTVLGVGVAWLAVKQHEATAHAYRLASHELWLISARLRTVENEESWAAEVADAEEAISREHTMWRAARAVHEPARHGRRTRVHPDASA